MSFDSLLENRGPFERNRRPCPRCGHRCARGFCDCKQRRQGHQNCGCGGCKG